MFERVRNTPLPSDFELKIFLCLEFIQQYMASAIERPQLLN